MNILLDEQQELAVKTNKKKVLVASAAGAGKTTVITERLKYLLNKGENPKNIYAITYTNNAAQEMRERINNSEIFIGTIHSFANFILLSNGVDTSEHLEEEEFDYLFEMVKEKNISLPEVDHLLIDEFQDICENEYEFTMETLTPKNFFVVGDSCQSIYGYKGSNYKYFIRFINDPTTYIYELNNNYRCGENIVDYANNFLKNMRDVYKIKVQCVREDKGRVYTEHFSYSKVISLLEENKDYKDWFILCRTNTQIQEMCSILDKSHIPNITFKKGDLSKEEIEKILNSNVVKVLTIHSAKGLEAKNVMVVGAKGWNPEELRVCYVAATRARDNLYWFTAPSKVKLRKDNFINWN